MCPLIVYTRANVLGRVVATELSIVQVCHGLTLSLMAANLDTEKS